MWEWLWNFLPDKCRQAGCCRHGVRGDENIVCGLDRSEPKDASDAGSLARDWEATARDAAEAINRFNRV